MSQILSFSKLPDDPIKSHSEICFPSILCTFNTFQIDVIKAFNVNNIFELAT